MYTWPEEKDRDKSLRSLNVFPESSWVKNQETTETHCIVTWVCHRDRLSFGIRRTEGQLTSCEGDTMWQTKEESDTTTYGWVITKWKSKQSVSSGQSQWWPDHRSSLHYFCYLLLLIMTHVSSPERILSNSGHCLGFAQSLQVATDLVLFRQLLLKSQALVENSQ